jgi:hypothetical protein
LIFNVFKILRFFDPTLVALNEDCLYAIGGSNYDFSVCLNSVERYDISRNEWTTVASMNVRRGGSAAAVYGTK